MYKKLIDFLENKKIAIVGFGREGKATYKFIRKYLKDQKLFILDSNINLKKDLDLTKDQNLVLNLGKNYLANLNDYDLIIKTPGISFHDLDSEVLSKVTSEHDLAFRFFKNNIIAITGTKGKSTTTSLIYNILKDQGFDAYLLGNIGVPIFDYIDKIKEDSIMVIESSAHQLEYVKSSPHIGIILNLFEEHLDFFKTKEAYFSAKLNMTKYQNNKDYLLYSSENTTLNDYINKYLSNASLIDVFKDFEIKDSNIIYNDEVIYDINDARLLIGNNQLKDIMFALRLALLLKIDMKKVRESINNFKPLEHRMEYVGTYNNVKYYNDAIATIPNATINCLESLKEVDTIIFGGMDRGISYQELITYFNNSKIENFICLKDTGYKIAKELKDKNVYLAKDLKDAVSYAKKVAKKICVMSPAAPSYNCYKNFEEKGNEFKNLVKNN